MYNISRSPRTSSMLTLQLARSEKMRNAMQRAKKKENTETMKICVTQAPKDELILLNFFAQPSSSFSFVASSVALGPLDIDNDIGRPLLALDPGLDPLPVDPTASTPLNPSPTED